MFKLFRVGQTVEITAQMSKLYPGKILWTDNLTGKSGKVVENVGLSAVNLVKIKLKGASESIYMMTSRLRRVD